MAPIRIEMLPKPLVLILYPENILLSALMDGDLFYRELALQKILRLLVRT